MWGNIFLIAALLLAVVVFLASRRMREELRARGAGAAPALEEVKVYIVIAYAVIVGLGFLFSLFAIFYLQLKLPGADLDVWYKIAAACLGHLAAILAGLLG
jgi:hypothetical protein